jgi:hypothetical protein
MWLAMQHPSISALRADALFVSALQPSDDPSTAQVQHAVAAAVREFGGLGCAGQVAQEFGDHPETAAVRMRWARVLASEAFGGPAAEPSVGRDGRSCSAVHPGRPTVTRVRPAA